MCRAPQPRLLLALPSAENVILSGYISIPVMAAFIADTIELGAMVEYLALQLVGYRLFKLLLDSNAYIQYPAAVQANKMVMILRVTIKPAQSTTVAQFKNLSGFLQYPQVSVDCSQADSGHDPASSLIHPLSRGMGGSAPKYLQDQFTLLGHPHFFSLH